MSRPEICTQCGTVLHRHKGFGGVGKSIGGAVYIHRDYAPSWIWDLLPDPENDRHRVTIIKITSANISFLDVPDFDISHEPQLLSRVTVNRDTGVASYAAYINGPIYHHKWLMVSDDYAGFDVAASVDRSRTWLALDGVDMTRIGNKVYWEKNVVPRIDRSSAE
jgi:hypothetical protein